MKIKPSLLAKITQFCVKKIFHEKNEVQLNSILKKQFEEGEQKYSAPRILKKMRHRQEIIDNTQVYYLNEQSKRNITILYLHGGAYISQIIYFHWKFIKSLIKKTHAEFIVPIYRLIPFATYKESYQLITKIYEDYVKANPDKKVIIMGDSAGGGLALGLMEYFAQNNIKMPYKSILFSPWLDITMSNKGIEQFKNKDVILNTTSLKFFGEKWASDLSKTDYKVSPIYGDLSKIDNIFLFVGTNEIFYPDIMKLHEILISKNKNSHLAIGQDLGHVYPLYPFKEGKVCRRICKKIILDKIK